MGAVQAELEQWRLQVLAEVNWRLTRAFVDPQRGASTNSGESADCALGGLEERLSMASIEISSIKLDVCKLGDALRAQGARVDELAKGTRCALGYSLRPEGCRDTGGELESIRATLEQVRSSLLSRRRLESETSPILPVSPRNALAPTTISEEGMDVRIEAPAADAGGTGSEQPSGAVSPAACARQVGGQVFHVASGPPPNARRVSAPVLLEAQQTMHVRVIGPSGGSSVHTPALRTPGTATPTAAGCQQLWLPTSAPEERAARHVGGAQTVGARPLTPVRAGPQAPAQVQRPVGHAGRETMHIQPAPTGGSPPLSGSSASVPLFLPAAGSASVPVPPTAAGRPGQVPVAVWRSPGTATPTASGRQPAWHTGAG